MRSKSRDAHLEDDGVTLLSGSDGDLLGELVHRLELGVDLLRARRIAERSRTSKAGERQKGLSLVSMLNR